MKKIFVIILSYLTLSFSAMAELKPFQEGEYLTSGGWGSMTISSDHDNKQFFEISTLNANGHSCTLSGEIIDRKAVLPGDKSNCEIIFYKKHPGIEVVVDEDVWSECRSYCGARAYFWSTYRSVSDQCTTDAMNKAFDSFIELKNQKRYAEAESLLTPILENCKETIHEYRDGQYRNQLAEVQGLLGKKQACLDTLQPWTELSKKTDDQVCHNETYSLAPFDCDETLFIIKDTREKLNFCSSF